MSVKRCSLDPVDPEDSLRMKSLSSKENMAATSGQRMNDEEVPLAPDGGWGWVVCAACFFCNLILDGIGYTFGVLLNPLTDYFKSDRGTISWAGSLLCGVYMLSGPIVGGLVNRFGCRPVCIAGAIIAWAGISASTLAGNVPMLLLTYGVVGGFGLGLIFLPAVVCVGHYFESKRALATGIAVSGSGVGTFLFAPLAAFLIDTFDWKTSNLIFASFFGICIICGLVMRPLVIPASGRDEAGRLTLQLPDGKLKQPMDRTQTFAGTSVSPMPKISEEEDAETAALNQAATAVTAPARRTRTISERPNGALTHNTSSVQLRTLRPQEGLPMSMSLASMSGLKYSNSQHRLSRPFLRKDVFLTGSITNVEIQGEIAVRRNSQSMLSLKERDRLMSRVSLMDAAMVEEEGDQGRIATVLKSMMDVSLLKNFKFMLLNLSSVAGFLGFYVPFMYLPSLVESREGITADQAALVLSVIGVSNTVGRILTGWLADRPWADPLTISNISLVLSSGCVFAFPFLHSYAMLITFATLFGLFIAAYISTTSIILVDLVGIDKLTTSFGLITMFRGTASVLGPPIAGAVFESTQSFTASFLMAGSFFLASALLSIVVEVIRRRENKP